MQKTDLNVSPYYDDFDTTDNFHRVLFRPGFAVQARELTQLQSTLQNQIERFGTHMFKEGAMVIPGQSGFTNEYYAVKLQSTFNSNPVSGYVNDYIGKTITGATSGVKATVIGYESATTTDPLTLYVKYTATGSDNTSTVFSDNEQIQANGVVGGIVAGSSSAQLQASSATATGSAANVEEGVYFVRGQFVRVTAQRIVLDKYTNTPSYRVGLSISETLVTPESDTSLLDNAAGSSNVNAKGAHRLKVTLTLAKLPIGSAEDEDFIEILRVRNGVIEDKVRNTEYSVLGETLARRTFDESGDYSVRPFGVDVRESLDDGLNEGVYASGTTTDQGASTSESLMAVQVSPGKAYVRGYEIETSAPTFLDLAKPRTTEEFKGAITPAEVGNFTKVTKVYGTPDLSPFVSGEITDPYKKISLRDTATATRGQAAGTEIGVARARAFEHRSGTDGTSDPLLAASGATTSQFNLYLFDIRMITKLTLSGTPSGGATVGAKITGQTSGATGFIHFANTNTIDVINVVGSFNTGEKVFTTSSTETDEILENSSNADLTITAVVTNTFDKVKQVFMDDPDSGQDFSADTVLDTSFSLSGTVSTAGSGTVVSGFGTRFVSELRVGDVINIAGVGDRIVASITDDDTLGVSVAPGVATTTVPATRKRVNLQDQNKNILIRKLRKNHIKTLKTDSNGNASVTAITVRRQFVVNSTNSGQLIVTADTNETFSANSNTDFVVSVLSNSGSGAAAGDLINMNSSNTTFNASGNTLTITNTNAFPAANIKCKVTTTVTRTASNQIPKTAQLASVCIVDNDGVAGAAAYGTSAHHKDVSLGVADAYKLWAVFDSEDASADAVLPQFTFTGQSGVFSKGEIIVGATTGARAVVIPGSSVLTYITQNNRDFQSGEKVTGQTSSAFATIDVLTDGSKNITERYVLDTGQRDNFYDIARIVRKGNAVAPTGRLMVVYNYFEHGAGDFFTVDSYSGVDYKEIPTYTATRVDPEVREPSGEFDLRNSIDFRPRVADATMTSATSAQGIATKKVTSMSFNFGSRSFTGTGGHTVLIPKDNSNIAYDFEFFLGRIDVLFLTQKGEFKISSGTPAEAPELPKTIENAMKIAEFTFPAYMLDIDDARIAKEDNRRYTMRDIGKLEQRIENVEYYTALNLLEQEAQSLEILDANGLNRFKSGFLVDNFKGHSTGDVQHPDYRVSMDMEEGELRPMHKMKGVTLKEENTTDAERTNDNYQKTGNLITLPYSHVVVAQNSYASRVENLNPVLNFTWTGICKLSPSGDEWFETERAPALIINREGNFNTVLAQNRNAIGTVWNAWQTQWSGTSTSTRRFRDHSFTSAASRSVPGRAIITRTTTTTTTRQSRSGINTRVVPRIDRESQGDRVVSRALIPFIRARNVSFEATGMKPLMRVYPFFDKTNVTSLVTPTGGSLGGNLVTTAGGSVSGVFAIPNPNTRGNVRFRTGERVFRLTTSPTNSTDPEPESFAQAIYSATGILTTLQETIIATRNADVVRTSVNDTRTTTDTSTRDAVTGWWDPLAQSVMPQAEGGEYLTKIDVFFGQKDENIPVTCQIRTMNTGYPTTKVLPFASKTLPPFFTGTVSLTSGSNIVTGSGTKFTEEFKVNDVLQFEGAYLSGGTLVTGVTSITSDTSMTLNSPAFTSVSGAKFGIPVNSVTGKQSSDASAPTTFHFDSPVYVQNGVEVAIVLQTDSDKYLAWISRMGEKDVGGNRMISEQPYLGVLFKSQNNSTWSAYDFEDLKFTLYRASFDTNVNAKLTLTNDVLESKTLEKDPLQFFASSTNVKVTHRDHHMYDTDSNVTISGVNSGIATTLNGAITDSATSLALTSVSLFPSSATSGSIHLKIGDEIVTGTISGTNVTSVTRAQDGTTAAAHANGATVELYQINNVPLTEINKTHTSISNIGIDSYVIATSTQSDTASTSGGLSVVATENAMIDGIQTLVPTIEHPDTTVTAEIRATTGTSPSGTQSSYSTAALTAQNAEKITIGENYFFSNPKLVASQINETNELAGSKSLFLDFNMSSTKENLSPVIDLDRKSIVAFTNRLNNIDSSSDVFPTTDFVSATEPDGDSNEAIYCTKRVTLQNPATSIKVLHSAVRFSGAEIQLMYKILRSDDASDFDEIGWRYFNSTGGPDTTVNESTTADDFIEYEYTQNDLEEFIAFAIKIRMQGVNSSEPPRIKDLRAIALAT